MLNIDKVNTVYLACDVTDFRKSIDGLAMIVMVRSARQSLPSPILWVVINKVKIK